MNLIEQLGGYERAKSIANCKSGIVHPTQQLLDALLEYRQANNIFEVGDYVLRNDGFFSVLKITGIDNGCADLVRMVDGDPRWSRFNLTDIRHTTDEEIKVGHRL